MLRKLYALCFLAFLPISANAISTVSVANSNCSGELTASTLDGASFACAGNFTFTDGFVTSDSLINISATGDLFLDNLVFTAPNITFSVLSGMMTIGNGVVFNGNSVNLTSNNSPVNNNPINIRPGVIFSLGSGGNLTLIQDQNLVIYPGGNIDVIQTPILTAVPEPSTYALMLVGTLGLLSIRRKSI
jgi:hypothetical protein